MIKPKGRINIFSIIIIMYIFITVHKPMIKLTNTAPIAFFAQTFGVDFFNFSQLRPERQWSNQGTTATAVLGAASAE